MRSFSRSAPLALLGLVGAMILPASALAQSIEDARGHWFDADFEAARDAFEAVLEGDDLTAAQAIDAHRYLAVLHMLLGNDAQARAHADAAVALRLDVGPPDGAPPETEDLFRMARRRLGGQQVRLSIEAARPLRLHEPGRIVAHLEPSPPALIGELRLRCGSEEARGRPPTVELELEPDGRVGCSVDAISPGGAALLTFDLELRVLGVEEDDGGRGLDDMRDTGEEERKAWPWAVGGAVGVVAVVGVVVAVLLLRGEDGARFGNATVMGW